MTNLLDIPPSLRLKWQSVSNVDTAASLHWISQERADLALYRIVSECEPELHDDLITALRNDTSAVIRLAVKRLETDGLIPEVVA